MPLINVGKLSALPPGTVMEVMVGEQPYAVCNVEGALYGLNGICPHSGGPLGQGQIENGHVVCPYHMWAFDCRTGQYDYDPSKGVATYEVRVEGGDIMLQVP